MIERRYRLTFVHPNDFDLHLEAYVKDGNNPFLALLENTVPIWPTSEGYVLDSVELTHTIETQDEPEQPTPAAEVIIELSKRVSALETMVNSLNASICVLKANQIQVDFSYKPQAPDYTDAGL